MRISAVSIDMFQTLINVDKSAENIWRAILGEQYHPDSIKQYIQEYYIFLSKVMGKVYETSEFTNLRTIFTDVFSLIKHTNNYNYIAEEAAHILMEEHSKASFFTDASEFLNQWNHTCQLWISSDADHIMIDPLLSKIKFDKKFISEDLKAYKQDKKDRFFKKVLSETCIDRQEILHIGDSPSDVIGAKNVGIKTCWINRLKTKWNKQSTPDYIIYDLMELPELLQKIEG